MTVKNDLLTDWHSKEIIIIGIVLVIIFYLWNKNKKVKDIDFNEDQKYAKTTNKEYQHV